MPEQINSMAGQLVGIPMGQVYTAGKGIVIDNVNKTVRTDETVLFTDTTMAGVSTCTLTEEATNFEYLDMVVGYPNNSNGLNYVRIPSATTYLHFTYQAGNGVTDYFARVYGVINGTAITVTHCKTMYSAYSSTSVDSIRNDSSSDMKCIYKVIGVNRIAGGN